MATYMRTKSEKEWKANERTGLSAIEDSLEYLISVPLDPRSPKERETEENFDLYYFVHTPSNVSTQKAVLFCAGGPGQIARTLDRSTTYADFLSKNGYHVVFFHLRGTGFSQIPPSANYDRFLRVDFAIEDIEAIRAHFLGNNNDGKPVLWETVIGWSFGTVVAQKYCHKYDDKVKKLILISPLSRDALSDEAKNPNYAFGRYYDAMLAIYRESLKEIFESKKEALQNEFGDLKPVERDKIITRLFGQPNNHGEGGILKETEDVFGSIQFVVDAYAEIQDEFSRFKLKKYSKEFYQSLSDLRLYGSNSIDDTGGSYEIERRIGKTLRDEVLDQRSVSRPPAKPERIRATQEYQRAYYAFGIYEGINWRFSTDLRNGKNYASALPTIGGSAQLNKDKAKRPNKWLEKIGIDPKVKIEPWDPAKYTHSVPTLILNGEADPITAGGQAERYFDAALDGARALMKFPRVGHNISLGGIGAGQTGIFKASPPLLSGAVHIAPPEIPAKETGEVTGVAAGWDLPASVWLKLIEPGNLAGAIRIYGCGILQDGKIADGEDGKGNIVALIKNKSKSEIHIQGREWTLSSKFLSGTVDFGTPKPIEPEGVRLVYGTLVDGRTNKDTEFRVQPGNLKGGLKFLAFRLIPPSSVELWIQNQGKNNMDGGLENWTLVTGDSGYRFKVDPPTLGENEIQPVVVGIDGLYIDQNEAVIVEPPAALQGNVLACLDPQEDNSSPLSFKIWNKSKNQLKVDVDGWQLKCPAFSATVKLESALVAPNTVQTVHGTAVGLKWARCLDLKLPAELEPELEMISYNVLEGNKLSLLIKNKTDRLVKGVPRDWPYVLPNGDSNMTDLNQALNALIYSFIVLDPEQFREPKDNTILERIASKFNLSPEDLLKFELKKAVRIRHRKTG